MPIGKSFFFGVFPVLHAAALGMVWMISGAGQISVGGDFSDAAEEVRLILAMPLLGHSRAILRAIYHPNSPVLAFFIFSVLLVANGFIWGAGLYAGNELILRLRKRLGRA